METLIEDVQMYVPAWYFLLKLLKQKKEDSKSSHDFWAHLPNHVIKKFHGFILWRVLLQEQKADNTD